MKSRTKLLLVWTKIAENSLKSIVIFKFRLKIANLLDITTDEAAVMRGKNESLVGKGKATHELLVNYIYIILDN